MPENMKQSGKLAFKAGIKKSDCPFVTGSPSRNLWLSGWNEAANEAARDIERTD